MNYTEEQLQEVEQYASIYLPITDIATILEISPEELREDINTSGSLVGRAYRTGKARSKVALRQQEMKLAQIGSPLALENTRNNLLDMEDDE